jgi:prevent-host-death family protein
LVVVADLSLTEARRSFGAIVRRAATDGERVTITDRGQPAAVLLSAHDLADLEEELALAHYRAMQASGTDTLVSHATVRRRLGIRAA